MNQEYQRVCAYVNLDAIIDNMRNMHAVLPEETRMIAVIKTDGYGHGALAIARELEQEEYVEGYAVATVEEAVALRKEKIEKSIMILGYAFPNAYETLVKYDIIPTVFTLDMAEQMSACAVRAGKKLRIHIKIDSGMSRIGFVPNEESIRSISSIIELPGLITEGIFTHFAKADYADKTDVTEKLLHFKSFVQQCEDETGYHFPIKHCANSAAIMELPDSRKGWNLVRAGVSLYGLWPSEEMRRDRIRLTPALELKSHIVYVKEIEEGTEVSYGGIYTAKKKTRLATIPVGYGDGYPRLLSNCGEVLICGKRAPICGRICMDQLMVDITEIPEAEELCEVTLIGRDHDEMITAEEIGEKTGRFNYELLCDLNKRVPRVYLKDGRETGRMDYFSD